MFASYSVFCLFNKLDDDDDDDDEAPEGAMGPAEDAIAPIAPAWLRV